MITDSGLSDPSDVRGWSHWVATDHDRRTVALLARDPAGGLLLTAGVCRVPLLLLPPPAEPPAAVSEDCLVRVTDPQLVVERLGADEPRVYLICAEDQVVPLQDRDVAMDSVPALAPAAAAAPVTGSVRLLLYQRSSPRRATVTSGAASGGAGGAGGVCVVLHGLLEDACRRRPVLLRVTGAVATRAARLTRGATYLLRSSEQHWTARE